MKFHPETISPVLFVLAVSSALAANPPQFTFTPIDVPGAVRTFAQGINDFGDIVGRYRTVLDPGTPEHGFLRHNGVFTTIDYPGALGLNRALGVNNAGAIIGFFSDGSGPPQGYLLVGGVFTVLAVPGAVVTVALGINATGDIVGVYAGPPDFAGHGFLLHQGVYTTFDFPGALDTTLAGIDAAGHIAGNWDTDPNTTGHGFASDHQGNVVSFDFPGVSSGTFANAINTRGQVVGFYDGTIPFGATTHGFLMDGKNFWTVDVPGSYPETTSLQGINSAGQIVGFARDGDNVRAHGYLITVPQSH